MNYALRIAFPAAQLRQWMSRVALVSEKTAFYEHNENVSRIHFHGVIFGCQVSDQTLKNWVKEALGLTPVANEWSFKETYGKGKERKRIDDGYIGYMSKGKYDPVYFTGYTPEYLSEWKAKGYDGKEDFRESPDVIFYKEFEKWMLSPDHGPQNSRDPHDFDWLKKSSFSYCITKHKVFNVQCAMKHKMCVMTYAWNHDISIPSKEVKFTV